MSDVRIQKISYGGWQNCVHISNNHIELIITTDVGPRIIRCGFINGPNLLGEIKTTLGKTGGDEWRIYGGHRLWHSPEHPERTYEPDNSSVQWEEIEDGIRTIQNTEPRTRIQKVMDIRLNADGPEVAVRHRLKNSGLWPVTLSVWSITVMATGGVEIIPLNRRDTGLLPNGNISLWPYTRLDDARLRLGERYIYLRQDPAIGHPFKIGTANEQGWAAYFNQGCMFMKFYRHRNDAPYPDFGASYETYVNDFMIEMETLSPLEKLEPGQQAMHDEKWLLAGNIPDPPVNDDETEAMISPHTKEHLSDSS
jgi:hypothetical protein